MRREGLVREARVCTQQPYDLEIGRVALSGSGSPRIGKCDSGDREALRTTFVVDSLMARAAALAINMSYEGVARVEHRLPKNHEPVIGAT